jgi:autotransporter-associated beta strand protein
MSRHLRNLPLVLCLLALLPAPMSRAVTNNLALTPPMGWNDWNNFGCGINENIVKNTAAAMATNGMKAAGYQFVNIDDCWQISRDTNGVIVPDPSKFPGGMKSLADYVHSLGLKLGIYTDHGTNTCQGKPGSYGYEYLDAYTYASWGVDYLKDDSCHEPAGDVPRTDYSKMGNGLMLSGRPIVFSLCPNMEHYEYWSPDVGNLWRTTGDISDTFSSMTSKIDQNSRSAYLAGPGRWNDSDMLEVGRGDFTNTVAAESHFTMWCIQAAPLIAGNNITNMSAQTLAILTNPEAIAVDQDPAGEEGVRVGGVPDIAEVWSKPLGYDFTTRAVALFNRSTNTSAVITCQWTNLAFQSGPATVRDLWMHTDLGTFTNTFATNVQPEGVVFLKIVGTPVASPGLGTNYLSDLHPIYAYSGFGTMTNDKSIGGNPLTLNGVVYSKGIGTHAIGGNEYNLGGVCSRFQSYIGVDDEVGTNGSVIFQVFADGLRIYESGILSGGSPTVFVDLDVTGVRRLTIGVTDTGNDLSSNRNFDDHSDWADALVIVTNATPSPPYAPTGLTASPGSQIALAWNPTTGANTYNVKRSTTNGGPYMTIASASTSIFSDTNVVMGTEYYYVVSAVNGFGESANSAPASVTACSPPAPPGGVTTTVGSSLVMVQWNGVAGATSYNVERGTSGTPYAMLATGLSAANYSDTNVAPGQIYFYIVSAANACNQSPFSTYVPAITAPSAPTGLTATPGDTEIALAWSGSTGALSYNVKRAVTNGGPYTVIASNVASPSYLDIGVPNGTTYYYVVSAVNGGGESANSGQASAVPSAPSAAYWTNTVPSTAQSWNDNANWTNSSVFPNSVGVATTINASIAANQTINLNQSITVGSLSIGDANESAAYVIAANGGSLSFNNGAGPAVLAQLSTSKGDTIAAPMSIATNLEVSSASTNILTLAGSISGAGATMTIGSGAVQIGDGTTNGSLGIASVTNNGELIFARSDNVAVSTAISGSGGLTQGGTGILTLSASNTFLGGLTIAQGTLQAGNAAALGAASGGTAVKSGATLDVNGFSLSSEPITVSGAGVNGKGAIVNSGAQQTAALRNVTLVGDTTFGGGAFEWNPNNNSNRWDIRAASNSSTNGCTLSTGGHAYKLTKTGGNQISLVAVDVDPALGVVDIQQGLLGWETATSSMGNPASNLFVQAGATLSFYNASTAWNKVFVLYGDGVTATVTNWSGANVMAGPVQLNGNCVFVGGGTSLALSNAVSGTGTLTKNGAYGLILAGTNTYSGNTIVNAGTLALTGMSSIASSPVINVGTGATLDASSLTSGSLVLAGGQTLKGGGTVKGNVNVGSGAILSPAGSFSKLTFSNALTLGAGSMTTLELGKAPLTNDAVAVVGNLTYGGTLVVTNLSASSLAAGDSFKLFSAANYSGAFAEIVPAIPAISLAWNTNNLSSGILSVVTAPTQSPTIATVTLSGSSLMFRGGGGVPGWPYFVLASTNLSLPLTNWSIVSSNAFDANGNFSFTNPAGDSAPQQYFLLKFQ